MLLAVDVGNTQTHLGAFDGDELAEHWRFATEAEATADELAVRVSALLELRGMRPGQSRGRSSPRSFRSSPPSTRGCASATSRGAA